MVAVHVSETEAAADAWMTGLGVTFPAVQDSAASDIFRSYVPAPETLYVPRVFIIDRDGIIRYDHTGSEAEAVIEGHLLDVVYIRDAVDVEMVMDVSDSMNSPSPSDPGGDTKLEIMKQAATMITDFLNDNGQVDDRMGLVWFTDDVEEYETLAGDKLLPIQANWGDLRAQILAHGTGICTAMGAGLQTAFDTLSASTQGRFVILCTDGMQNVQPKVAEVGGHFEIINAGGWECGSGVSSVDEHPGVDIASYDARVHTIGIGITDTYRPLLEDVADATVGFFKGTDDPVTDLDFI